MFLSKSWVIHLFRAPNIIAFPCSFLISRSLSFLIFFLFSPLWDRMSLCSPRELRFLCSPVSPSEVLWSSCAPPYPAIQLTSVATVFWDRSLFSPGWQPGTPSPASPLTFSLLINRVSSQITFSFTYPKHLKACFISSLFTFRFLPMA